MSTKNENNYTDLVSNLYTGQHVRRSINAKSGTKNAELVSDSYANRQGRHALKAETGTKYTDLVSELYARWALDCLVDLAYAVSKDCVNRPYMYKSDSIPSEISDLLLGYGAGPSLPDAARRRMMLVPIFGAPDWQEAAAAPTPSSFRDARKQLVDACAAYAERAVDTGIQMLKERVKSALVPLRAHLENVEGRSIELSYRHIRAVSDTAAKILKSGGVAGVFGQPAPDTGWPFSTNDPKGANVVSRIGATLTVPDNCVFSYTQFILLQRVASEGRRALNHIMAQDLASDKNLQDLIGSVYTWSSSISDYRAAKSAAQTPLQRADHVLKRV